MGRKSAVSVIAGLIVLLSASVAQAQHPRTFHAPAAAVLDVYGNVHGA
jgi:hypothetical protein